MDTRVISLLPGAGPSPSEIEAMVLILRSGGVGALPTDTFYGFGANAFSGEAVERIYALKERDRGKPLPIVVPDFETALAASSDPVPDFFRLAGAFWPGPLTLVLRAAPVFPAAILGPGGTIALRVPALGWLRDLMIRLKCPLTATSANPSGGGDIDDPAVVRRLFAGRVDLIVDGGRTPGGAPSTIVDLASGPPRLLRSGAVSWEAIQNRLRA